VFNPDPSVNDQIVNLLQRRANALPQWLMPPSDADFEAAREEAERAAWDKENEGDRFE
jgi:hypothetical protein